MSFCALALSPKNKRSARDGRMNAEKQDERIGVLITHLATDLYGFVVPKATRARTAVNVKVEQRNARMPSRRWCSRRGIVLPMKTATVQQLPAQWLQILRWVAASGEVEVTQQDKVIAKVVPATATSQPDFLARAKAILCEQRAGKPLSAVVADAR
jgi:antitoxin (DNA-binding transcriptional repressor) of toxin-antitoxin stability system